MPLYQCYSPDELLDDEQRQAIATAIVDVHCGLTTAPPTFVHVQFHDRDRTDGDTAVILTAGLRAGRPASVTEGLVSGVTDAVSRIGGIDPSDISMRAVETPASWIYEGGRVLPEPGDEDAWLEAGAHA